MPPARALALPPPSRGRVARSLATFVATIFACALACACGPALRANADAGRLRFVASQATQATWSFRVDDHAQGAELLVDGRPRTSGCDRAGREVRCELFGLWPGGHQVELRLPGALLRRSALVGKPWPERPLLVRARSSDEAVVVADAGADGVVLDARLAGGAPELSDLVDVVHARGARAVVIGDASTIELASADALYGADVTPEIARRFPEARAFVVDDAAGRAAAAGLRSSDDVPLLLHARGVVEARGAVGAALGLLAARGALVEPPPLPLLRARKRHAALRDGSPRLASWEPGHLVVELTAPKDRVLLVVNDRDEPWLYRPDVPAPLDLLGNHVSDAGVTVAPHDVAAIVTTPAPDRTRF